MERKHNTDLTNNARTLRKNMTKEERHLWYDFLKSYPIRFLRQIFNFCDKVETFYNSCIKKNIPDDEFERNGYIAFWNEWNRRRYGK